MGLGDDVMSVGAAARLHADGGRKVVIGRPGQRYWSPMFEHVPFLVRPEQGTGDAFWLHDYTGKRPYIDYRSCRPDHQALHPGYRATPGHLYFSDEERIAAAQFLDAAEISPGFIAVEPHVKEIFSGKNKAWPWKHWEALCESMHEHQVVQFSKPGEKVLDGVGAVTDFTDVRLALATLSHAGCVVTTDGLFHHAAAALKIPAVVLWGSRTNPEILGYLKHENLTSANPVWCGSMRQTCQHCVDAMKSIEPQRVWLAVEKRCKTRVA